MISSSKEAREASGITGAVSVMSKNKSKSLRHQNFLMMHKALCDRCKKLKLLDEANGEMDIKNIENLHVVKANPINADIFAAQVGKIRSQIAWAIHVVDATDIDGSLIRSVRDIVGKNPLILAVTKADLLPEDLENPTVRHRLKSVFRERANLKGFNVVDVFLMSGLLNQGVEEMVEYCSASLHGKDVYVFGNANVGKSTLVNAFTQQMLLRKTRYAGRKGLKRKKVLAETRTTTSNLPGTTLFSVRIPCFPSYRHALWDTPGLFPQRYDWFQGAGCILPPNPDILTPQLLQWIPGESCIHVRMEGILLRLEMQPTAETSANDRSGYNLRKHRPKLVWYSKFDITPEVHAGPGGSDHLANAPDGDVAVDADAATAAAAKTSKDQSALFLYKTIIPKLDKMNCFSLDVVLNGLGWMSMSFESPHEVKIFVPKLGYASTTIRPAFFHPNYAERQLMYIDSMRSVEATVRMGNLDAIQRSESDNYSTTHSNAASDFKKARGVQGALVRGGDPAGAGMRNRHAPRNGFVEDLDYEYEEDFDDFMYGDDPASKDPKELF
jgi:hypothetical protein